MKKGGSVLYYQSKKSTNAHKIPVFCCFYLLICNKGRITFVNFSLCEYILCSFYGPFFFLYRSENSKVTERERKRDCISGIEIILSHQCKDHRKTFSEDAPSVVCHPAAAYRPPNHLFFYCCCCCCLVVTRFIKQRQRANHKLI
jgi:hypothetical protein